MFSKFLFEFQFNFAANDRHRGDRLEVDPSTLSKMIPKNDDDDDWASDKLMRGQNKFNQTQTVFGDDVGCHQKNKKQGYPFFASSFHK